MEYHDGARPKASNSIFSCAPFFSTHRSHIVCLGPGNYHIHKHKHSAGVRVYGCVFVFKKELNHAYTHRTIPGVHVCVYFMVRSVQFVENSAHTHTHCFHFSVDIRLTVHVHHACAFCLYTHTQTNTHNKHMHTHIINNKTSHVVVNLEKRLFLQHIFLSY